MREYTTEEIREKFIKHIEVLIEYWDNQNISSYEKLDGLAFSILSTLDGSNMALPRFIIAPLPHPDDKKYLTEQGKNYYPENHKIYHKIKGDISGSLHEIFAQLKKE